MKNFLLLLLLVLAPGLLSLIPYSDLFGNKHYQTEQEALNACIDWERARGKYNEYTLLYGRKIDWERSPRGFCLKNMSGKKFYYGRKVFVKREGEYDRNGEMRVDDVIRWHYKK